MAAPKLWGNVGYLHNVNVACIEGDRVAATAARFPVEARRASRGDRSKAIGEEAPHLPRRLVAAHPRGASPSAITDGLGLGTSSLGASVDA